MISVRRLLGITVGALLLAPFAAAQEPLEEVEVIRDAVELKEAMESTYDRDFVDTALVFTNQRRWGARVHCVGYDGNGRPVGRVWLKVPPRGVRFAFASDVANDRDFIGSVRCRTRGRVLGSAFLLKPLAITDLPSHQGPKLRCLTAEAVAEPIPELASPEPVSAEALSEQPKPVPARRCAHRIRFPVVATY
jgi:hypothetical protein